MTVFTALTTSKLPDGYVGQVYEASFAVNYATAAELTVEAGTTQTNKQALPSGLSYTATGRITGTPTVSGVFNLSVKVTDGTTSLDNQPLTLVIHSADVQEAGGYDTEQADAGFTLTNALTRQWPETV